jgi:hypothetical protein
MARNTIEIQHPLAGLDRAYAVQSQPPFTLPDALNVRGRSVFDQRSVLGSRPGLIKAYAQLIGPDVLIVSADGGYDPAKDAELYSDFPTTNSGLGNALHVGVEIGGKLRRSVLHFVLTTIPVGATITSAHLTFHISYLTAPSGIAVKVRRLTTFTWVEDQVTWARASDAVNWTDGGQYDTALEVDANINNASGTGSSQINNLSALVDDAMVLRGGQLHLIIMAADEAYTGTKFVQLSSGESTIPPRLTVAYTFIGGPSA